MTDPDHDLDLPAALSTLRSEVRRRVPRPAAVSLRRRAEHRRRVRRAVTALVAAAVVGAVLIGGGLVWHSAAPIPPATGDGSPTTSQSAGPPPRPNKPIPARPTPQIPDAFASTNWQRVAVSLPTHPGCPSGVVSFRRQPFKGGDAVVGPNTWPRVTIEAGTVVYGDLTGDGRPEAVLYASCWQDEEDSGDGQGQLLVVSRDGQTLRAIGWVGPRGALVADHWVDSGQLHLDVKPWQEDWGYLLGAAESYRWTGQVFARIDDPRYAGLVPRGAGLGPVIDLGPVVGLTGCPPVTLRFGPDGRTTAAGTNWDLIQPSLPDDDQHLVDLNGDAKRWLLATITCGRPADSPFPTGGTGFLAVLERQPDGSYRAADAIRPPEGMFVAGWLYQAGTLTLEFGRPNGTLQRRYAWNGEYFQEGSG